MHTFQVHLLLHYKSWRVHGSLLTATSFATHNYHTSNSRECMGVNGEALQLHAVYKSRIFYYKPREKPHQYYKSCENPYQVLQVTCVTVTGWLGDQRKVVLTVWWQRLTTFVLPKEICFAGENKVVLKCTFNKVSGINTMGNCGQIMYMRQACKVYI